ncbi:type IX secretion system PorP/SprF family membrane protein [Tenacibaculum lutimaris]|uniref:Type IX secretion system PorP/SprF family membrane protein n=1 Tax=Tenacibaculum lutimaris TaxID=285258 RepID=A0A420E055_9FLAO|nr:type IX secretion system membrane protein PorP/SprF [Tenacibaculum lutimaris]RKF03485.1 type IX secretion system PorP/SprF family membrane protein [Tenacibaculum lutimaris]
MRKILIILGVVFSSVKATAQEVELPQYVSHLADNPFVISPTYAGIGTGLQVRLNGVSQWIGVKDAPDTQSLTVEARIADTFGGGISLFNDSNGFTTQKGAKLSFASHLTLSDFHDSFLSFALSYSFIQFGQDTSQDNTNSGKPSRAINHSNFDVGLLYRFEKFSITANVVNLLNRDVENFETGEPEELRKYVVFSSYIFSRISRGFELEPSILYEYREATGRSKTDMNIKARKGIRDGYVWAGLSYTFLNDQFFQPNAIAPLFGLKKDNLYLSYGFSINMNKTQDFNYGTHMITLGFDYERRQSLARCTQKMIMF